MLVVPALAGCHKKEYETQCETSVKALGIGFDNTETPRGEAIRAAQLAKTTGALATWESSKASVVLADLRAADDAVAVVLTERKALLTAATFASPTAPAPANAAALEANEASYAPALQRVVGVCSQHL
jgi:hypothetical protein